MPPSLRALSRVADGQRRKRRRRGFLTCSIGSTARRTGIPGYFKENPRDVFGDHVWVTPFWEDQIDELLDDVPVDRLLLGSDWPHAEGVVQPADFVTESLGNLTEDAVLRVSRENALEVLGLGKA